MDYSYAALVGRSSVSIDAVELDAPLDAISGSGTLRVDGACFPWVARRLESWASTTGVALKPLPKVGGVPASDTEPVLMCSPDRAGRLLPGDRTARVPTVVVGHAFDHVGGLRAITVSVLGTGGATPSQPAVPGRGHDLARRVRQVRGVEPVFKVHRTWCVYRQPARAHDVLTRMARVGIAAGDALDVPGMPGGIAAIVPASATESDLAAYAAGLEHALAE